MNKVKGIEIYVKNKKGRFLPYLAGVFYLVFGNSFLLVNMLSCR